MGAGGGGVIPGFRVSVGFSLETDLYLVNSRNREHGNRENMAFVKKYKKQNYFSTRNTKKLNTCDKKSMNVRIVFIL